MDQLALYEDAVMNLSEKRFAEAYALFKQCLGVKEIDQANVLFNCGWCLENTGRKQEETFNYYLASYRIADHNELKLNAGFRYSWLLIEENNYSQAQAFLSKIIAETGLSLTESVIFRYAIYWFGVCLEHEGRYLGAIDNYCKLRPFTEEGLTLEARYREIICLIQVGKLLEALKNADDFLQLKPLPGSEGQRQAELIKMVTYEKLQIERAFAEA